MDVTSQILLYLLPIVGLVVWRLFLMEEIKKYDVSWLKWVNLTTVLLPLWLVSIYLFGTLIFDYNILPFAFYFAIFTVGIYLYEYVTVVETFTYRQFFHGAHRIFFISLTQFLFGLMILRFILLIVG